MESTMMRFPLTLSCVLERAGAYFERTEIVERRPDRSIARTTIGNFYNRSRALAESLMKSGLRKGDRVATFLWNDTVHLEAYFGVPAAGGVVHPVNIRLHPDEIAYIVRHAGDRFLIIDAALLPLLEKIKNQAAFERVWVAGAAPGAPLPAGADHYESLIAGANGNFTYPILNEDDPAAMCYTSGTTGRSKGVVYSHRSIVLHTFAEVMPDAFGISQHDAVLVISPMFHVNGWGLPHSAVFTGAKLVLTGMHFDPAAILDLIVSENITVTGAIPTIWIAVRDALEAQPTRWKIKNTLRAVVGGAAPPAALLRALEKFNIKLMHAWGMTETSPVATFGSLKSNLLSLPECQQFETRCKQGWSVPFMETRVVDAGGAVVAWGGRDPGELQVRGPWVAASYYNNPETADRWTADGWFKTGDVATIDADGYICITDRAKDLIKSGGEWISSVDLENAIMGHPGVHEAAVVAVPHPKWQERPLAVVARRAHSEVTAAELSEFLSGHFAKWQIPDAFVFVSEIPKTSIGKFKKTALREQYKDWKWC
ncbi:MAG: long-chain fatty acid--CoA ligase [Planctomycetes bacterium]|nr:long-chain fatty acid--CoA ligase [Planctomycetota bacterium]